jgi:hypothetical protein
VTSGRPDDGPVSLDIDGDSAKIIRRDTNTDQEVITVTVDRIQLCLVAARGKLENRKNWQFPAGMAVTALVTALTASGYRDRFLNDSQWQMVFIGAAAIGIVWTAVSWFRSRETVTNADIIAQLRGEMSIDVEPRRTGRYPGETPSSRGGRR